jgi:hypothetical protein
MSDKPKKQRAAAKTKANVPAPTQPDESKRHVLQIKQDRKEPAENTMARMILQPHVNAVSTTTFYQPLSRQTNINAMLEELKAATVKVQGGDLSDQEAMLAAQATSLDNIFNFLAQRAFKNITGGYLHAGDTLLRLALKAQSQSRTTVEALAEIKFPKSATFIRQANIAAQQQVNNGAAGQPPADAERAPEKDVTPTNELLEQQHGKWLDIGTQAAAGTVDSNVVAMGKLNRSKKQRG